VRPAPVSESVAAKAAKENKSLTAKDAKTAKQNKSFTAKNAKENYIRKPTSGLMQPRAFPFATLGVVLAFLGSWF